MDFSYLTFQAKNCQAWSGPPARFTRIAIAAAEGTAVSGPIFLTQGNPLSTLPKKNMRFTYY